MMLLGMNAQWEADMENHVATYECEWKAAIETPELRKTLFTFCKCTGRKRSNSKFRTHEGAGKSKGLEIKQVER
jgi:nitrite reductase (NADH) large subunit